MFYNSNISDVGIQGNLDKIEMFFEFNKKEKLKYIINIFEILNKNQEIL